MNRKVLILILLSLLTFSSCKKVDRNKPFISSIKVNGDASDTVFTLEQSLSISYEVSDDVMIVDTKLKLVEQGNLDSGFFYLAIEPVNSNNYSGLNTVTIPDSVATDSTYLKVSVDAYDNSGNQATQLSKIINFQ